MLGLAACFNFQPVYPDQSMRKLKGSSAEFAGKNSGSISRITIYR